MESALSALSMPRFARYSNRPAISPALDGATERKASILRRVAEASASNTLSALDICFIINLKVI
jgi:hypothetical protein